MVKVVCFYLIPCFINVHFYPAVLLLLTQQPSTGNSAESGVLVAAAGVIIQVMCHCLSQATVPQGSTTCSEQ